jgi:AmmeMemoRadiSam system protein B
MNPKLREIQVHPIQHQGQQMILLRDPLHLTDVQLAIPQPLAPLLGLMDGTRDEAALEAALQIRAGVRLAPGLMSNLVMDLDEALLLDNERFAQAKAEALHSYRKAPFRPMTTDGAGLSAKLDLARAQLQAFLEALPPSQLPDSKASESAPIRGMVSPHIDYERGGPVYAEVWRAAAEAAREAELVIMLGTDHQGSEGTLTLTHQSYGTPWGALPTDGLVVDTLADVLGKEAAFAEELHHRGEHSVELAAVWLHFIREGEPVPMVPILCGHFGPFVEGLADPVDYEPFADAVCVLREAMASQRTLVVAAADLAHMGPAFGDPYGLDYIGRAQLRSADERLLDTVCAGDAAAFFRELRDEGDQRHVCGLPPIYLALRLLGETRGELAGYALCPADQQGMSFVSIAGVILH